MGVNLVKGGNVVIAKQGEGLSKVFVGLGWDPRETDGEEFDLDGSALLLDASGKVPNDDHFVFYGSRNETPDGKKKSPEGSVIHDGDDRTGGNSAGDDEVIHVDLSLVPDSIEKIVFPVSIYDAQGRKQNFGQVSNSYIRVVNEESGEELVRYDLGEDFATEIAMVFGELYKSAGNWKFRAVGQGYSGGLAQIATTYGVNV